MSKGLTSKRFPVILEGTHGLVVPDEVVLPFIEAGHKRIQILAYFEDRMISFHGAIHRYKERYLISFGKRYQKELGVLPTDFFEIQFKEDTTQYGVEIPEEFQAVLDSDPEGAAHFSTLTDGRKRGLIYYIIRFKTSQTRIDKSIIILENLKRGIRDPREIIKPL